jgi:hypothetical protein
MKWVAPHPGISLSSDGAQHMIFDEHETGLHCTIRVGGRLEEDWSDWFLELDIVSLPDSTTLLTGHLPDQGALHGVLARIANLGLPLLCVDVDGHCGIPMSP